MMRNLHHILRSVYATCYNSGNSEILGILIKFQAPVERQCEPPDSLSWSFTFANALFLCVGQSLRHCNGRYIYIFKWLKLQKQITVEKKNM